MKWLFPLLSLFFLMACYGTPSGEAFLPPAEPVLDWSAWPEDSGEALGPDHFIQVQGTDLVTPDGEIFLIKGMAFGNEVWANPPLPTTTHHSAVDYQRLKELGFNAVRFYLNYRLFEEDDHPYQYKENGFRWIDVNIAAAREQGIYLILNMHYPQGGFQSGGDSDELWTVRENQQRLTALWQEIARRYREEQQIIGYGLVNEPVPNSSLDQWKQLAQGITQAIRREDPHHILFIEKAIYVKPDFYTDENHNFILIDDPSQQYLLEFHFYEPMAFSHQGADWIDLYRNTQAQYPDETSLEIQGVWSWEANHSTANLEAGDSGWAYFESPLFRVENPRYSLGIPSMQAMNLGEQGRVWFDQITIDHLDSQGNYLETLAALPLDNQDGWYLWQDEGKTSAQAILQEGGGHDGGGAFLISGSTSNTVYSNSSRAVPLVQGDMYRISGWMKGSRIPNRAFVNIKMDLYHLEGSLGYRNRAYLESEINNIAAFARANNLPLYLGEFGTIRQSFMEDRGGMTYVRDMLEILNERGISYSYHTYHEWNFGLYYSDGNVPINEQEKNEQLEQLFREVQL